MVLDNWFALRVALYLSFDVFFHIVCGWWGGVVLLLSWVLGFEGLSEGV